MSQQQLLVSADAIQAGFNRIEVLARIHGGKEQADIEEALTAIQSYFGMDEEDRLTMAKRIVQLSDDEHAKRGWVLLGVLIGLSIAEYTKGE